MRNWVFRIQTSEAIDDALARVDREMFNKPGDRPLASIPARPDRDTDLVLSDAITELYAWREGRREQLEIRPNG